MESGSLPGGTEVVAALDVLARGPDVRGGSPRLRAGSDPDASGRGTAGDPCLLS